MPPPRLRLMRDRLFAGLAAAVPGVSLNGPALQPPDLRLPGNLNVSFAQVAGEALLLNLKDIALSSGSACTSAQPEPSHVLRSLGLSDEAVGGSVRFGLGRFNTAEEVETVIARVAEAVARLRKAQQHGRIAAWLPRLGTVLIFGRRHVASGPKMGLSPLVALPHG